MRRALVAAALAAALPSAAAGCGLGAGPSSKDDPLTLTVTRDFGARGLVRRTAKDVPQSETVMRLLQRSAAVKTRYGGGFVQCIEGLCGAAGVDWFYFVNGVEAPKGAAATRVRGGDRIWWDRRGWGSAERVPAVVGSFPEPFLHGPGATKRLPVRVECVELQGAACKAVQRRLAGYGIPAAKVVLRSSIAQETLRVLVGPWKALREEPAAALLEGGPRASGVFAEPRPAGDAIALLDARGRVTGTLGAGGGLVAATRAGEEPPVWVVAGVDEAGVTAAARAFSEAALRDRFAVATDGAATRALPVRERSP